MQKILSSKKNYIDLKKYLQNNKYQNILLVCGNHFFKSDLYKKIIEYTNNLNINIHIFKDFEPNPSYESVCLGVKKFIDNNCDFIIAVGGGSSIDVAKCIKLYSNMDHSKNYLNQEFIPNNTKILAIPTTAGTGSEATKYSVIYYKGEKQSITSDSCIPEIVLFDNNSLETLSIYQKKATLLDAFSHSIESLWSINSTEESINYAIESIKLIIKNINKYLENDSSIFKDMFEASNLAGKAINISRTTAGHAMCYKLTTKYNISHGHAAMLINSELLPYMMENTNKCSDPRGEKHLKEIFSIIKKTLKCKNNNELKNYFRNLLDKLDLYNVEVNKKDIDLLVKSVNVTRLSNNPIKLENNDIKIIYERLFDRIGDKQ